MEPTFQFRFIPAPDELAPHINTLFAFETDEARLEDVLPAYSAQLLTFGCGNAQMDFGDGRIEQSSAASFIAPMKRAASFRMEGPARVCGISLTTLGWASLAGLPVDRFGHCTFPVHEILGEQASARVARAGEAFAAGEVTAERACAALTEVMRDSLSPILPQHIRFIEAMSDWLSSGLNPSFDDLLDRMPVSPRQVQRLARRYFGKPPTGLVRRYRAIRAATLLSQETLAPEMRSQVLDAFFDQAHMIRDIRHFTGRTPTGLGREGETLAANTLGPQGYGVIDLFGGTGVSHVEGQV